MKKLVLLSFCVLFSAAIASAGIFRQSAKVVKPTVITGYNAAKDTGNVLRYSGKVASYPVRHPVKVAKKSAKVAYKVAY